jgi:hypothetical protein
MAANSSNTSKRTLVHTRQITCEAYLRDDGLYDVEGRMSDTKTQEAVLPFKTVQRGERYHDMRIVLTVDDSLTIRHVEARTVSAPTPYCREINAAYGALAGLTIGPGFKAQVKLRVGGVGGCTHLTDLLGPMATTAIQATLGKKQTSAHLQSIAAPDVKLPRPWVIDTCHAYRLDGDAVKVIWPEGKRAATP